MQPTDRVAIQIVRRTYRHLEATAGVAVRERARSISSKMSSWRASTPAQSSDSTAELEVIRSCCTKNYV
jgi:hypothetical protein